MAKFFINRPIVAISISILIVLIGWISMKGLPVAQYPDIVPPEIQVSATYTGANAVAVEQSVATPIEQQVNGVENMIYMRSINANDGTISLRVTFETGSDLDMSNVLVQNRVSQAEASLPEEVKKLGVTVKKSLSFPLMIVSLHSPNNTYDNRFLSNYSTINVNDALARIQGVGQITLFGGSDYAMRVWVKPDRLAKLDLTVPDIISVIREQNVLAPGGQIGGPPAPKGQQFTYTVRLKDRLKTPEEFGEIIVRSNPDGSQVKLKDIARIEMGTQLYNATGRLDGQPAAVIGIYQIPGSNALKVASEVKKTMNELAGRFPDDVKYQISLDTTLAVEASIDGIIHTLLEAIFLVILVVFIFLQNWKATLIPLLTVPVSLVGAFAVFPLLGFSINTLSLLGLVLAIGIVVDDAIVVVEAVMHHIEHGMSPKEATIKAMEEVSGPVIAIALILTAVFVPVGFMGGITGRLYQQFAITIAISVLFSAFSALTLSPALCAILLKPAAPSKGWLAKFFTFFNNCFGWLTDRYVGIAGFFARKLLRMGAVMAVLVFAIMVLGKAIPGGFVPEEDQGYFMVNVQLPDASSLERSDVVCGKVEKILKELNGVSSYTTITGYSLLTSAYSSNNGYFFISLKPWKERGKGETAFDLIKRVNPILKAQIPEATVMAFGPPPIQGLGTSAGFSLMLQDQSGGTPEFLEAQAQKLTEALTARPEIEQAFTPFRASVPQIFVDVNREKAATLGISLTDLNSTLGAFLGGSYINDFNRFGRLYKVYMQAEPEYRARTEDMASFYVRSKTGQMVPLSTLTKTESIKGPEFTNRFNLFRTAEITGIPAAGISSAQAMKAAEEVANEILPKEMSYSWNAVSYQEKKAAGTGNTIFIAALIFVFLILAAQYESWTLPFSVLLGTPFAVFGAFLGLFLANYVNNVFAQIGLITLIGLAAKNAILIVEFANMKVKEGLGVFEAALEGAKLRFRPILMTAFAFILGVVPLLTASGAGAEARKIMGMSVFSGMLVATILGVILVPALFTMIGKVNPSKKPDTSSSTKAPAASH